MDIQTVLGITWHQASAQDVLLVAGLLMIPIAIIIIAKVLQRLKYKRIHDEQIFLFKLKRLGLSNFQIKIINNLIEILEFSNPNQLFDDPEYFESAIGKFLTHTRTTDESEESQFMMCRDITSIYEKLYFNTRSKKPLRNIADLDNEQLIYFSPVPGRAFLGKINSRDNRSLYLTIFGRPADLAGIPPEKAGYIPDIPGRRCGI